MCSRRLTALTAVLLAAGLAPATGAARGLTTGFNSDPTLTGPSARSNPFWVDQARAEGAGIVRLTVLWSAVAPTQRPRNFAPGDPASPGYDWSAVDAQVKTLTGHGLGVLITISSAPAWAEGPDRPAGVRAGTWEPNPAQFAQFAHAAAERYDGRFAAPGQTVALPRVGYWQAWNEPNLDTYLTPQWSRGRTGLHPASPGVYRPLLNAFYAAVKGASPANVVVTAGMAPYGNPPGVSFPGGFRMAPLVFDRALLSRPTYLDVLAQNIYPVHGPLWHAYQPNDVAAADLFKVRAVLQRATAAGTAQPRSPKRLWITELGWTSRPPNPGGVPVAQQARWYEQALYTLWRQGIDTVLLLQIVDAPPIPTYAASYQTGLYYMSGQPKPAATAFRFPFVAERNGRGVVTIWGRAPEAGRLRIERAGRGWDAVASLAVNRNQVFTETVRLHGRATLRGQIGDQVSLDWTA